MLSNWIFILLGIAALYSITIFSIQVVRYFIHKTPENELLDEELEEDQE